PRVQFLKDVDGDGRVDHLHSSEAAALEYLIALGHDLDPFDVERDGRPMELGSLLSPTVKDLQEVGLPVVPSVVRPQDASWAPAILAYVLEEVPIVYASRRTALSFSAVYRTPVEHRRMRAEPDVEVDHECVAVQTDSRYVYVHCCRYGVAAVPRDTFDSACGVVATTADHSPPDEDAEPSEVVERVLTETELPALVAVDSERLEPEHATGTVPFILAVEENPIDDWKEGIEHGLPADAVELAAYITALMLWDRLPVYRKGYMEFKKWLLKHERDIVGLERPEWIDPVVEDPVMEIARKLEGCLEDVEVPEEAVKSALEFLKKHRYGSWASLRIRRD
ncbi:hypothetical protein, partial [Methanopyrus sp.]